MAMLTYFEAYAVLESASSISELGYLKKSDGEVVKPDSQRGSPPDLGCSSRGLGAYMTGGLPCAIGISL